MAPIPDPAPPLAETPGFLKCEALLQHEQRLSGLRLAVTPPTGVQARPHLAGRVGAAMGQKRRDLEPWGVYQSQNWSKPKKATAFFVCLWIGPPPKKQVRTGRCFCPRRISPNQQEEWSQRSPKRFSGSETCASQRPPAPCAFFAPSASRKTSRHSGVPTLEPSARSMSSSLEKVSTSSASTAKRPNRRIRPPAGVPVCFLQLPTEECHCPPPSPIWRCRNGSRGSHPCFSSTT